MQYELLKNTGFFHQLHLLKRMFLKSLYYKLGANSVRTSGVLVPLVHFLMAPEFWPLGTPESCTGQNIGLMDHGFSYVNTSTLSNFILKSSRFDFSVSSFIIQSLDFPPLITELQILGRRSHLPASCGICMRHFIAQRCFRNHVITYNIQTEYSVLNTKIIGPFVLWSCLAEVCTFPYHQLLVLSALVKRFCIHQSLNYSV